MLKCQNLAVAVYRDRWGGKVGDGYGGVKGGAVTGAFMQKLTITWPGLPRNQARDNVIAA